MHEYEVTLTDTSVHTINADWWGFDGQDNMIFYKDNRPVFERPWKEIQFVYTERHKNGTEEKYEEIEISEVNEQ